MIEFPHKNMDKRPRKRPRLTWDMPPLVPPPPKVLPAIYCGHEFTNVAVPSYAYSSMYYKGVPRNGSPPWRPDDKDGHYVFVVGDNITPRYRILSKMGEGTFGRVLECLDNERKEIVAIKIVRSIHKYREAAMIEIDVLQKLARHDIGGTRYLRGLDQACMTFSAKIAIVHFQLILSGNLADNFWNLLHLCMIYG